MSKEDTVAVVELIGGKLCSRAVLQLQIRIIKGDQKTTSEFGYLPNFRRRLSYRIIAVVELLENISVRTVKYYLYNGSTVHKISRIQMIRVYSLVTWRQGLPKAYQQA
jgi:hypothetical protein